MQQVLDASLQLAAECQGTRMAADQLPWAAQIRQALQDAGVEFDPEQRAPLQPAAVRDAAPLPAPIHL